MRQTFQNGWFDWKDIFGKHGLRENLEKTEVGQQRKDLDIRLDGKKLNQRGREEKRKTETEMDGLCEKFSGSERGMENECEG